MFRTLVSTIVWRVRSIPIFFKILGIGFLVAILFGGVTLFQTRASASEVFYELLKRTSLSTALMLAESVETPTSTGDLPTVMRHIREAKEAFPDIRYVIVRNREGHIVASTFEGGIPPDLQRYSVPPNPSNCGIGTLDSRGDFILDVHCPIGGGDVGSIQLGVQDDIVAQQLAVLRDGVLSALALCVTLGAGLALLLTHLLTRPIHHLVESANRIREGEFETRADAFSNDEIGRLAVAFNEMAAGLMQYRREVQAKEKARLSLIERIVQAQENERKILSRELHDQLGQSLLALLLKVQSNHDLGAPRDPLLQDVEKTIRQIAEEVHRLAGGMRPSILDDYGLDSALARHIEEVSQSSGLDIDYQFTSPPGLDRLPSRIEVPLFRIAQEALANVLRHAQASHASVIVLRQLRDVTLLIEDDGQGFDPGILQETGDRCLGLVGMKERVALLGGSLAIQSVPREGTTIRARIPLSEDTDAYPDLDRG